MEKLQMIATKRVSGKTEKRDRVPISWISAVTHEYKHTCKFGWMTSLTTDV